MLKQRKEWLHLVLAPNLRLSIERSVRATQSLCGQERGVVNFVSHGLCWASLFIYIALAKAINNIGHSYCEAIIRPMDETGPEFLALRTPYF